MKDIKVKTTNTKPKILEKVSNVSKDAKSVMKEQLINQAENLKPEFKDKSQENATDYATGKIENGTQTAVNKTIIVADKAKDFTVRIVRIDDRLLKMPDVAIEPCHSLSVKSVARNGGSSDGCRRV